MSDGSNGSGEPGGSTISWGSPVLWIGILIIFGLGAFIVFLIHDASSTEPTWSRLVFIYGGIEALAFAAVGALFGTRVQRGQVLDARKQAEQSSERANRNESDARAFQAVKAQARTEARLEGFEGDEVFDEGLSTDRIGELSGSTETSAALRLLIFIHELERGN